MTQDSDLDLSALLVAVIFVISCAGCAALGGFSWWRSTAESLRTNVLILGLDHRPEQGYTVRSDTMILVTVHPRGPRVALLSIPRDLYVEIPGHGTNRINTAHFWGENEAGGSWPALAMETAAHNLGVPVHHGKKARMPQA